jgi:two-component sensor histidine kinase/PAS domain-containing protein
MPFSLRLPNRLSTRTYLFGLVAAVIVPLVAAACFGVFNYARTERARYERDALQIAYQVSLIVESDLNGLLSLLQGLASSAALERLDYAVFHAEASRMVEGRRAVVVLRDLERTVLLNTQLPYGGSYASPREIPAQDRAMLLAGSPFVSNVFPNPVSGEPVIAVVMPVPRGAGAPLALAVVVPTTRIRDVLVPAVPAGWVVGIGDRNNIWVTRSARHEDVSGRPSLREYTDRAQGRSGTFTSVNFEGTRLLAGFQRPEFSGWLYGANIPESVVAAPLWRSLTIVGVGGILAIALSSVFAYGLGRQLAATARGLAAQARALGEGRVEAPRRTTITEFALVGEALAVAAESLRERTSELEAVLETVPAGVSFTYDPLAKKVVRNKVDAELMRIRPGVSGSIAAGSNGFEHVRLLRDGVPVPADEMPLRRAIRGQRVIDEEYTLEFADGTSTTILTNASPLRSEFGAVVGAVAVRIDITDRKRSDEQRRILINELSHRVKNTLAMVQALASQTARSAPSIEEFKESFSARVTALAATHDLLTASDWCDVELDDIVRAELAPYVDSIRASREVEGPQVMIPALLVTPIGLVVHELTTNAVKHGALADERGRLSVRWSEDGDDLRIDWHENTARQTDRATSGGFGSKLIQRIVTGQLSGTIESCVVEGGFHCTIVFPLRDLRGRLAPTIGGVV